RPGRITAGLGSRRGVDARTRPVDSGHADAQRARVFSTVDGDVVLRSDRAKDVTSQAHRTHRRTGGLMSRIDRILDEARGRLRRMPARDVPAALERGAVLVDIRPHAQRQREGEVPTAMVIERNVLEWRCDPTSDARIREAVGDDVEWVVLCSEGYTSSL